MGNLQDVVWWHVYPLGAVGAPIRGWELDTGGGGERTAVAAVPRLRLLESWLDYAVDLGCSGLLLGPVFRSTGHGYDTIDHFRVDPRLGDEHDFDRLLSAAADRGLAVVLDGVFNHVGRDHPLVQRAVAVGLRGDGHDVVRVEWSEGALRPRPWEGHAGLVELNHDHPEVKELVTEVMLHWLRRGVAGWRLDVAYAVPPAFWRETLARVRTSFPDAFFLGEVIHGDYAVVAEAGTLDAVTQYELWKAVWSSLVDRNFWELAWALERHEQFSRQVLMQTFVGNHDVDRIAGVVGDAGAALALTTVMTLPGMPSVYYGDEQAFRGSKGEGPAADDDLRPPLPARPEHLAPDGWWMYRLHQDLIGLRRRNPWLTGARLRVVGKDNTWIVYECTAEGHTLRVELDVSGRPAARVVLDGVEQAVRMQPEGSPASTAGS